MLKENSTFQLRLFVMALILLTLIVRADDPPLTTSGSIVLFYNYTNSCDVNGDDKITQTDLNLVKRELALSGRARHLDKNHPPHMSPNLIDINADSQISSADVSEIEQWLSNDETQMAQSLCGKSCAWPLRCKITADKPFPVASGTQVTFKIEKAAGVGVIGGRINIAGNPENFDSVPATFTRTIQVNTNASGVIANFAQISPRCSVDATISTGCVIDVAVDGVPATGTGPVEVDKGAQVTLTMRLLNAVAPPPFSSISIDAQGKPTRFCKDAAGNWKMPCVWTLPWNGTGRADGKIRLVGQAESLQCQSRQIKVKSVPLDCTLTATPGSIDTTQNFTVNFDPKPMGATYAITVENTNNLPSDPGVTSGIFSGLGWPSPGPIHIVGTMTKDGESAYCSTSVQVTIPAPPSCFILVQNPDPADTSHTRISVTGANGTGPITSRELKLNGVVVGANGIVSQTLFDAVAALGRVTGPGGSTTCTANVPSTPTTACRPSCSIGFSQNPVAQGASTYVTVYSENTCPLESIVLTQPWTQDPGDLTIPYFLSDGDIAVTAQIISQGPEPLIFRTATCSAQLTIGTPQPSPAPNPPSP